MSNKRNKVHKHRLIPRIFAAFGIWTLFTCIILNIIFGFSFIIISCILLALTSIIGPVLIKGVSGISELLISILE